MDTVSHRVEGIFVGMEISDQRVSASSCRPLGTKGFAACHGVTHSNLPGVFPTGLSVPETKVTHPSLKCVVGQPTYRSLVSSRRGYYLGMALGTPFLIAVGDVNASVWRNA